MSRFKKLLEGVREDRKAEELSDELSGYFEDVIFTMEMMSTMKNLSSNLQLKILKLRKDMMKIQHEIERESKK